MDNLKKHIEQFMKDRNPIDRYASFDYCFNYFHSFKDKKDIVNKEHLQLSCLHLWFYLASRWMYRWSSFLLRKSVKIYENLLKEITSFDKKIWEIDIENYDNHDNRILVLNCYHTIKKTLLNKESHITLVTKIMMGIFGCIPAYDTYFCKAFKELSWWKCKFTVVNEKSLLCISEFYKQNKQIIDEYAQKTKTLDMSSGKDTNISYTKAKIIDMIWFIYWLHL